MTAKGTLVSGPSKAGFARGALVFFGKTAAMVAAGRLVNAFIDAVKEGYEQEKQKRAAKGER